MQAILTKYLGPTNHRGARIKVTADAGTITVPWDHALSPSSNHMAAALKFATDRNWLAGYKLVGGSLPSSDGYAFVVTL